MHTKQRRWDVERAAAWLRRHGWGDAGEQPAPRLDAQVLADAAQAGAAPDDEIGCWPARAAPFRD
jgi:hypothetical protein